MRFLKKNASTILFSIVLLIFYFSTDAKAFVQEGLMKIGLFQPEIKQNSTTILSLSEQRFQLIDSNGNKFNLSDLKGKIVFINFWATWCPPCIAELPTIQKLYDHNNNNTDVVFLMVEIEGNYSKAIDLFKRKDLNLPIFLPNSSIPSILYKGTLPTTVILDQNGNLVFQHEGIADYSNEKMFQFIQDLKIEKN